jgi:hypothetical protein
LFWLKVDESGEHRQHFHEILRPCMFPCRWIDVVQGRSPLTGWVFGPVGHPRFEDVSSSYLIVEDVAGDGAKPAAAELDLLGFR